MQSSIVIEYPPWLIDFVKNAAPPQNEEEAMRLAMALARANVEREHGGPFGALIIQKTSNVIISAGVNCVQRNNNSMLHAEVMALMMAEHSIGSYSLKGEGSPQYALITTCEPCAMCLGAALWSGVSSIACGARRADAQAIGFDEGPVFEASYRYLSQKGITMTFGLLAEEARALFALYRDKNGLIYNG
ncbi:MAG: nucleoside deaminase [Chitinivibrionales bacterium]|nr:nucleoside deaminase [Chitinivibrionales bacterium]